MKKTIICFLLFVAVSVTVHAQLVNSKWKGILKIDGDVNTRFDFGKDTLTVYNLDEKVIIETMTYTSTASTFTLKKVSGQSDCDNGTAGKYKYGINGNELSITLLEDACDDRSSAIKNLVLTRSMQGS